jgi:hypothetical protein
MKVDGDLVSIRPGGATSLSRDLLAAGKTAEQLNTSIAKSLKQYF